MEPVHEVLVVDEQQWIPRRARAGPRSIDRHRVRMAREQRHEARAGRFDPVRVVHDDVEACAGDPAHVRAERVAARGRIPAAPREVDVEYIDVAPRERDHVVLRGDERGKAVEALFARQARRGWKRRVRR